MAPTGPCVSIGHELARKVDLVEREPCVPSGLGCVVRTSLVAVGHVGECQVPVARAIVLRILGQHSLMGESKYQLG